MHNLPSRFFKWSIQILYVLVCSVFFLVFILVYEPFGLHSILEMGKGLFSMNLAICFSISLVLHSGLRVAFHFMNRVKHFTWAHYIVWCMGEVLLISIFMAMYIHLMKAEGGSYFNTLTSFVGYCYLIYIFPYLVLTLSFTVGDYREKARNIKNEQAESDDSLIHFYDEHQRDKLIIARDAVLYISAEENYVNIHYLKTGRPTEFVLRASMRSLEESAEKHGLVRCQRSYYVNPTHVKVLRKESAGQIVAELDVAGLPVIPVSRTYAEKLTERL